MMYRFCVLLLQLLLVPYIHLQTLKGDVICSPGQRLSLKLTPASDVGQPVAAKLMSAARYDISLASRASLAL